MEVRRKEKLDRIARRGGSRVGLGVSGLPFRKKRRGVGTGSSAALAVRGGNSRALGTQPTGLHLPCRLRRESGQAVYGSCLHLQREIGIPTLSSCAGRVRTSRQSLIGKRRNFACTESHFLQQAIRNLEGCQGGVHRRQTGSIWLGLNREGMDAASVFGQRFIESVNKAHRGGTTRKLEDVHGSRGGRVTIKSGPGASLCIIAERSLDPHLNSFLDSRGESQVQESDRGLPEREGGDEYWA